MTGCWLITVQGFFFFFPLTMINEAAGNKSNTGVKLLSDMSVSKFPIRFQIKPSDASEPPRDPYSDASPHLRPSVPAAPRLPFPLLRLFLADRRAQIHFFETRRTDFSPQECRLRRRDGLRRFCLSPPSPSFSSPSPSLSLFISNEQFACKDSCRTIFRSWLCLNLRPLDGSVTTKLQPLGSSTVLRALTVFRKKKKADVVITNTNTRRRSRFSNMK